MADDLHPGVFVEEIQRGPRPIEGVPTSTAAILGEAERGAITPRLVTSYNDYRRWFGDVFGDTKFLPYAVSGFFDNGGRHAVICRLVANSATTAAAPFGEFIVRSAGPGAWGARVFAKVSDSTTKNAHGAAVGFRLQLAYWSGDVPAVDPFTDEGRRADPPPGLIEDFDDLVTDETSPDYYGKRLRVVDLERSDADQGEGSALAVLVRGVGVPKDARPANGATWLRGGTDGESTLGVDDYRGLKAGGRLNDQGLAALELDAYRDIALVYAPMVGADIATAIISHCEHMRFRFAVIDSDQGQSSPNDLDPRVKISDTSYAAFYFPWLVIADPPTGGRKLVPPGGSVLGVYARSDNERGVFKAPANVIVRGALGLECDVNDRMQDDLNRKGVNVIRAFPGRGIYVWGARTLSANALWKYVSVRRLFSFLERSIDQGTQWVVFEPNDDRLRARVTDTIRLFLREQWRLGALFGRTEAEAFFIRCDRTTMTEDDILNGRLVCEIGVAPARPAEFVIFRIVQHTAEAQA